MNNENNDLLNNNILNNSVDPNLIINTTPTNQNDIGQVDSKIENVSTRMERIVQNYRAHRILFWVLGVVILILLVLFYLNGQYVYQSHFRINS